MYHILVVDDEPAIGELLERVLARLPFPTVVTVVHDGTEALTALKCAHADLLITDDQMPQMDGVRLTRRLRFVGNTIPILFLAGAPNHLDAALAAGATVVAQKPVSVPTILELAAQLLGETL